MGLPERVFPVIDWVFPCCIFRVRRARVPGGKVSAAEIVPEMQSGAMLIGLDPDAPCWASARAPGRELFLLAPFAPADLQRRDGSRGAQGFFWRCGQTVDRQRPIAGAGRRLCQGRGDRQQTLRADSAFAPDQHRADGDFGASAF